MILFRNAVLIIHGFAGGTYDVENLSNYLEKNYKLDVFTFTLPGHEKRTFKTRTYQEWIECCEQKMKFLLNSGYRHIYLVGHSMGGVIATYLANKYPEVKKIVLAAPAFNFITEVNSEKNIESRISCGIEAFKNNPKSEIISRFLKLPISSLNEFVKLTDKYKTEYLNLRIPTLIVQGISDTLVPYKNSKYIYDQLECKKNIIYLENITHDIFRECDEDTLKEIEKFLLF